MIEFSNSYYNTPEFCDKIIDIYVNQLHQDVKTLDNDAPCSLCAKFFS